MENVVFENIQVNITFTDSKHDDNSWWGYNVGGIVAGEAKEVDNVIVRNSEAVFNVAPSSDYSKSARFGGIVGEGSVKKSVFKESSLTCNITSLNNNYSYIAGIVGADIYVHNVQSDISNNNVMNSKITASCKGYINCGGIIGNLCNDVVTSCITKDCIIDVQSFSSSTSRVGGIVGYCEKKGEIGNCASIGNDIKLISSYGYNIGGVIGKADGKVTNCLSDSNILEGITYSTKSDQYAGIGGLCGSNSATISKSVSQNNRITGTYSTKSDSMFAAGFIVSVGASVVNCGCYNNTVNGGYKDVFSNQKEDLLYNCYIAETDQSEPNVNNLSYLPYEDFRDNLSLDKELWTFESGYLNLKIAE